MEQSRNWCFTLKAETWTPEKIQERLNYDYVVFQLEKAESGFEHYQGYISHSSVIRFTTLKNLFPDIHLEVRKAPTHQQAIDYCTKEDTRISGPYEFGERPVDKKSNAKLDDFIEDIMSGLEYMDLVYKYPGLMMRYEKFYHELRKKYLEEEFKKDRPKEVIYIYGLPGTGKTRYVMDHCRNESYYVAEKHRDGSFLFDSYSEEHTLILEEFNSNVEYTTLLQLLDRYPFRFPCRYSNKMSFVDKVYMTSNLSLDWQYLELAYGQNKDALNRRITKIIEITQTEIIEYEHITNDCLLPFQEVKRYKNPYF